MVPWWFHLRLGVGIGANEPDQKLWGIVACRFLLGLVGEYFCIL